MQIQVHHRTEYRYSEPLMASVQYVRLTARSGASQTVERWKIGCPGADLTEWTDHYGNICHTLVLARPASAITIEVAGSVRTMETNGVVPVGSTALKPEIYLRDTPYTRPDPQLQKLARRFEQALASDPIAGLHQLMLGVKGAVLYRKDSTTVHTTAAEALADGYGVCQDHTHVFIAACRLLDVPARYVSGYLCHRDGPQQTTASHAWAEALVPDLGWVSFDCANGISATEAYVRVAVGLDYADAGPVRGVRLGGGDEGLAVQVALSPRTAPVSAASEMRARESKKVVEQQQQQGAQ